MTLKRFSNTLTRNSKSSSTLDKYEVEELRGCGFQSSVVIPSLTFGSIVRNRIHSSATKYTHFKSLLFSLEGGTCSIKIYRDAVVDTVGTLVPNVYKNMNHNSSVTATTLGYTGSTYSSATLFKSIVAHGDTTAVSSMGTGFTELAYETLVCKKDEDYFIEIENIDQNSDTAYFINIIGTIFELDYGIEE